MGCWMEGWWDWTDSLRGRYEVVTNIPKHPLLLYHLLSLCCEPMNGPGAVCLHL